MPKNLLGFPFSTTVFVNAALSGKSKSRSRLIVFYNRHFGASFSILGVVACKEAEFNSEVK